MLWALRPSCTCSSIQARCSSQAEQPVLGAGAGGRGGGICPSRTSLLPLSEPVATPGEFAARSARPRRRIVLRSTPVMRSISRWLVSLDSSVRTVICRCDFKTFNPVLPVEKGKQRNVPPQTRPRRRPAPDQFRGGGISSGLRWRKLAGRQGLPEDAYFGLVTYSYATKWGDEGCGGRPRIHLRCEAEVQKALSRFPIRPDAELRNHW